jgi:hypothetical protein
MTSKPTLYTTNDLESEAITLCYDDAVIALRDGRIYEEVGLMRWGSNYTFLVKVEHEDTQFMAIYKPRKGERPLWDFPDGTLCQRETASYVLSDMLGWYVVPPTILRDGSRGEGSVQLFVSHDPERHYFTLDAGFADQMKRLALFDALANNADRKGGHCLVDDVERVWGIDHGLTFHAMNKLRTVIWDYAGEKIPPALYADIEALCKRLDDSTDDGRQQLATLLSEVELRALHRRLNQLLQTGEYPMPGSGPNRPWPAV